MIGSGERSVVRLKDIDISDIVFSVQYAVIFIAISTIVSKSQTNVQRMKEGFSSTAQYGGPIGLPDPFGPFPIAGQPLRRREKHAYQLLGTAAYDTVLCSDR
jgi:hypothetical protein